MTAQFVLSAEVDAAILLAAVACAPRVPSHAAVVAALRAVVVRAAALPIREFVDLPFRPGSWDMYVLTMAKAEWDVCPPAPQATLSLSTAEIAPSRAPLQK